MILQAYKWLVFTTLSISLMCCTTNTDDSTSDTTTSSSEEKNIDINGINHFFKIVGSGEPILVLHGGPGLFQDYLTPHFSELSKHYQLIFFDQRGSGKTDFPKDTSSITIDNFVSDIEAIRKHFKIEKLTIAGHSWGGLLALFYAKQYPDQLKNLILISPGPSNSAFYEKMLANMQQKRTEEDTKKLVQLMMSKAFEKREPETFKNAIILGDKVNFYNQESATEMYKTITFNGDNASKMLMISSLLERNFFNYDIVDGLDKVNCPTLIIIGDMDNVPFASAQALQENMKHARIEVIKKSAHYPFFEDNQAFSKTIKDFLNPEYED